MQSYSSPHHRHCIHFMMHMITLFSITIILPRMSPSPLTVQVPPVRALTVWVTQLSSSVRELDDMVQQMQRELVDGSGDSKEFSQCS